MENKENIEKEVIVKKEKLIVPIILAFVFAILASVALFHATDKKPDLVIGQKAFDNVKNEMLNLGDKKSENNSETK